ncbi:MAG: hypothetical protein V4692_07645 [Bdellovibrionota bacterium]
MKSTRGFLSLLVAASLLSACAVKSKRAELQDADDQPVGVADEMSLKADRTELDELRKDIPEDLKKENDELALVLSMMKDGTEEPGKVRDRFNTAVRKKREKSDKLMRKQREDFTKLERKTRDEFLKTQKSEREKFVDKAKKRSSDERRDFFNEQDTKRRDFFSNQSDSRREFESKITEDRKTFEDYVREQTNRFNQEHRAYSTGYYDRQKAEALKKRMDEKEKQIK